MPVSFGQCRLCGSGDVEDVTHLLLTCSAHDKHRTKMLAVVEKAATVAGVGPLNALPAQEQTDILLGKSTGAAAADSCINNGVTRFLKKAWRSRKPLTEALNSTLGRDDTV